MTKQAGNRARMRFHQPFFCEGLQNYTCRETESPYKLFFSEFSTAELIDRAENPFFLKCIPDGCVTMIFIQNGQYRTIELLGTTFSAKQLIAYPGALYFCVRLPPGMLLPYPHTSDKSLQTKDIAGTEMFLPRLNQNMECLAKDLFSAPAFEKRVQLFCEYLNSMNRESFMVKDNVAEIIDLIYHSGGNVNIHELAKQICYSERQLSRLFSEALGYPPKLFARIVRFQHIVGSILKNPHEAQTAVSRFIEDANYSDQAHFQREFKEFTTLTPREFMKLAEMKGYHARCESCGGRQHCMRPLA